MAIGKKYGGRAKGTPNKSTADVRAAVAEIARNNVGNVQAWLDKTAKKQPARALQLFMDLIEYHIPKLSRTEMTGEGGKPLEVSVVRYSDPKPVEPPSVSTAPMERS